MPTASETVDPNLLADTRNEIRQLVNEVAQLAASEATPAQFYEGFLSRVLAAMAAIGGAIWLKQPDGSQQLAFHANLPATGLGDAKQPGHRSLLAKVAEGKQALVVPPHAGTGNKDTQDNPTPHLLVLAPLLLQYETRAIVEVFQRPGGGPTTQRGYLRFLVQMAELASDFLKTQHLRQLKERQQLWHQLEQFMLAVHRSLELAPTAYAIVNEGRRIAGCERVSLVQWKQGRCEVLAISGLDSLDRRAKQVKLLAELSRAVLKTREPLWHAHGSGDVPPQIEAPLQAYLDQSHARLLAVIPLVIAGTNADAASTASDKRPPLGALVIEQLSDDRAAVDLASRADLIAQHSASALAAVQSHQSILLLPLWKMLGNLGVVSTLRALPKLLAAVTVLAAIVAGLFYIPADFEVAARGKLQPVDRREVFAQLSGVVDQLLVRHGDFVQAGQPLLQLTSHDLEEQLTTLLGEQSTITEQIAATERALLDNRSGQGTRLNPADENRLSAESLELKQRQNNLERELALFRQKQQQLKVIAPAAGQVVTWKVEQQLLHRPVERGQALLSLADPAGPWELELYVPERRLKHLAAARQATTNAANHESLEVTFTLASHPGQTFRGQVVEVEKMAQVRGEDGNTILVRVQVDKSQLPELHDQVTVTGKLYCGKRSLGFVWFCDLIETVQSKVLFWL